MSILYRDENVVVCGPSGWEIIHDEPNGERWCFICRKRREFRYIVGRDPSPDDWYGPSPSIQCSVCKSIDGDCGFGSVREWEDW